MLPHYDVIYCLRRVALGHTSSRARILGHGLKHTTISLLQLNVADICASREQKWVASGSFDRTIKLWDLGRTSSEPIVTLNAADSTGPKSSIYAMAVDPFGHTIVSGGPERVIRLWDPRAGKRIGKLVGHTDNIRSILVSEDSRYVRQFTFL